MITARALGTYMYLHLTGAPISAESLSRQFKEGRKAFLPVLKELRDLGLITTSRQLVNGKYVTQSYLSNGSPKTALLFQQYGLNSPYIHIANSLNSKPNHDASVVQGENMEWIDPDDLPDVIRKHNKKKHDDKQEAYRIRTEKRMQRRQENNSDLWTPTDSAFEFASQMHNLFHIAPWRVTRSDFIYALSIKRDEYGTNGSVELVMMRLFFDSIKHDTKLSDPEKVWKIFIKNFHNLLNSARSAMVTPEQMLEEKEKAQRSQDWLNDV